MVRVNTPKLLGQDQADDTSTVKPSRKTPSERRSRTNSGSQDKTSARRQTRAKSDTRPAGGGAGGTRSAEPAEPDGIPGEKRITLPLWESLWRALQLARIDDGVDTTIRLRSMIELWEHDERIRARVDKLAKKRAATLSRGRPRRDS